MTYINAQLLKRCVSTRSEFLSLGHRQDTDAKLMGIVDEEKERLAAWLHPGRFGILLF